MAGGQFLNGTNQNSNEFETAGIIMLSLLNGFSWLDEGLQNYLRSRGWPAVTRPQSMVMACIEMGLQHPSDIARRLGVSRQAIHNTLKSMIDLDMIDLVEHPTNKRVKTVELTTMGDAMRKDAKASMRLMLETLNERLGPQKVIQLANLLTMDWGTPLTFDAVEPSEDR